MVSAMGHIMNSRIDVFYWSQLGLRNSRMIIARQECLAKSNHGLLRFGESPLLRGSLKHFYYFTHLTCS